MNFQAKLILSALGVCALPLAQAGDFEDFGRVVRTQPRVEQIRTPHRECRTDYVEAPVAQPRLRKVALSEFAQGRWKVPKSRGRRHWKKIPPV